MFHNLYVETPELNFVRDSLTFYSSDCVWCDGIPRLFKYPEGNLSVERVTKYHRFACDVMYLQNDQFFGLCVTKRWDFSPERVCLYVRKYSFDLLFSTCTFETLRDIFDSRKNGQYCR